MVEMLLPIALESLSILLLLGLLYAYWKNYQSLKTSVGLGLIAFSAILLVQNAFMLYYHSMMVSYYNETVALHATVLQGLEFLALSVLAYITWKE